MEYDKNGKAITTAAQIMQVIEEKKAKAAKVKAEREAAKAPKEKAAKLVEAKEVKSKVEYLKVCMNLPRADVQLMKKVTGNDNTSGMLRKIFGEYVKAHQD